MMEGSGRKSIKGCTNYKALESDIITKYGSNVMGVNCKDCVYFSCRNCGMDAGDSIEPPMDFFC